MPLIDEENNLIDIHLMGDVAQNFSVRDGLIIDKNGDQWYLWRTDGLDSWWRFFEEIIDAPMGRKLANAGCDEEEYLLRSGELDFSGFFSKKKAKAAMQYRWNLRGWGTPNLNPPSFDSAGLTPLFAGILQADLERVNSERYRMLWEQKSVETTFLTLDKSNITIPKSTPMNQLEGIGEPMVLELESGWRIDGLSHILLPSGIFKRLEESCTGLVANLGDDERKSWPNISEGFLAIAIACKKLFIAGEELFLAADVDGWVDSCKSFFGSRGFSDPICAKSLDSNGGIEIQFKTIPCLALTVGYLAGAWVRSEGRPVKVSVERTEDFDIIRLESRHEISHT